MAPCARAPVRLELPRGAAGMAVLACGPTATAVITAAGEVLRRHVACHRRMALSIGDSGAGGGVPTGYSSAIDSCVEHGRVELSFALAPKRPP